MNSLTMLFFLNFNLKFQNAQQQNHGPTVSLERMEVSNQADSRHDAEMFAEFDRRRRARTLTLPTDDVQVQF